MKKKTDGNISEKKEANLENISHPISSTPKNNRYNLLSIQNKIFRLSEDLIGIDRIIENCKKNRDLSQLKNILEDRVLLDGKFWNLKYAGSLHDFIQNIKTYYVSNLQEKYLSIKMLTDFFSSDLKNIELISLNKLGIVIINENLYVIKKNIDLKKLDKEELVMEKSTSFIGVEILGKDKLGDLVFLDSENNFRPLLSISAENIKESSEDNIDFISKINARLDMATSILESLTARNLDTIENRRIYVEACLQKLDRRKTINTAKKILILEDALLIARATKYHEIVLEKLINNYMIFIKELISLGEIKQFIKFIDKIINKFGNIVMVPIVETVIEFAGAVKNPDMSIDFLIRAFKLASSEQIKEIRKKMIIEVKRYHSLLIERLDFPGIINLQTRISSYLTNTNKIKILKDLSKLIKDSTGKVHPKKFIMLLETFFELSRPLQKDCTTRQKRIITKLNKSFEGKLFDSYVDNAKTLINSLLFDKSEYKELDDILHLAYFNCGDNDTFKDIISEHFLKVIQKYEYQMDIDSPKKIKLCKYALSFSNEEISQEIKTILIKEEYFNDNFHAGLESFLEDDFIYSLSSFRNATVIKPKFFENWYHIGLNHYNLENYEMAKNSFYCSVKFSNYKDIYSLYKYAKTLEKLESYKKSNEILDILLKIEHDHYDARILKITIFEKTKNYIDLLKLYNETINIIIDNEKEENEREEKLSPLWAKYTQIVQSYIDDRSIFNAEEKNVFIFSLNSLSESFIKINSFDRIFFIYQTLKKLNKKIEGKLFKYISKHLSEQIEESYTKEYFEKSIEYSEELLEIDPENVEAYSTIGNCYVLLGQSDKAVEYVEKAVELRPNNRPNLNNLAALYYTTKQYTKCINFLHDILREYPDYGVGYYNIALCYNCKKQYKPALLNFIKYLHLHTSKIELINSIKNILSNCISNNLLDEEILISLKKILDFSTQYGDIHSIKKLIDFIDNSELSTDIRQKFEDIFKKDSEKQ
ncbi:MAG: tetratricopeptide repeat protein [Candidatus Lokiarchaeota archaeon]|nr:tetratricopeptide repeat protein [Candidatus Lokiarchaeota archaeon]